jgi:hypothetical protein
MFMEEPKNLETELDSFEPHVNILKCKGNFYAMCFEK